MTKQIIFSLLPILVLLRCSNAGAAHANAGKKTTAADSNNQTKQAMKKSTNGFAPVNGLNMYYELYGDGEPLVLIHGGGSTIQTTFGNILPLFAEKYKVIAVELQAHGHTKDRNQPSSFQQDADDVAALLAYLQIKKAHILGFSNGGSTALQIAIRHPALVNKVVAVSAVCKRDGMMAGFFDMMKNANLTNMPAPLQTAYLAIPGNTQEGLQTMHDRDKIRMLELKDWPDSDLKKIHAPTLIIGSDKDVVTAQHTTQIAQTIPHASLMILPGIHGAAIGEICTTAAGSKIPALTVGMIVDFLDAPIATSNK